MLMIDGINTPILLKQGGNSCGKWSEGLEWSGVVWKSFRQGELLEKHKFRVGLDCPSQILNMKISLWRLLSAGQPRSHEKVETWTKMVKKKGRKKMLINSNRAAEMGQCYFWAPSWLLCFPFPLLCICLFEQIRKQRLRRRRALLFEKEKLCKNTDLKCSSPPTLFELGFGCGFLWGAVDFFSNSLLSSSSYSAKGC